jgi:hypothetical protein
VASRIELKEIRGDNSYCGPSAISTIAGITTDRAAKLAAKLRKNTKPVRSMRNAEVHEILRQLGYEVELTWPAPRPTFAQWVKMGRRDKDAAYVVNCGRHYIVVRGQQAVDNIRRKPGSIRSFGRYQRSRVRMFMRVTRRKKK